MALAGRELPLFIVLQGLTMACFAFTSSNLGTLAMENMAPIAGTASSVQGVVRTIGAAPIGFVIGQRFDGTVVPFVVGNAGLRGRRVRADRADRAEAAVRATHRPTTGAGSFLAVPERIAEQREQLCSAE